MASHVIETAAPDKQPSDWSTVPISSIDVGQRLRRTDNRQVEALMATIATVGLINALTVHRLSDRGQEGLLPSYGLIAGAHRLEACRRLAADSPGLAIVVNHCGTPLDRDAEGLARWSAGLATMARQPNVAIKLSNFGAYGPDLALPSLRATLLPFIEAFGPDRAMFATDYPVGRRAMALRDICERFNVIVADFPAAEQSALFHDTAARLYRFDRA